MLVFERLRLNLLKLLIFWPSRSFSDITILEKKSWLSSNQNFQSQASEKQVLLSQISVHYQNKISLSLFVRVLMISLLTDLNKWKEKDSWKVSQKNLWLWRTLYYLSLYQGIKNARGQTFDVSTPLCLPWPIPTSLTASGCSPDPTIHWDRKSVVYRWIL